MSAHEEPHTTSFSPSENCKRLVFHVGFWKAALKRTGWFVLFYILVGFALHATMELHGKVSDFLDLSIITDEWGFMFLKDNMPIYFSDGFLLISVVGFFSSQVLLSLFLKQKYFENLDGTGALGIYTYSAFYKFTGSDEVEFRPMMVPLIIFYFLLLFSIYTFLHKFEYSLMIFFVIFILVFIFHILPRKRDVAVWIAGQPSKLSEWQFRERGRDLFYEFKQFFRDKNLMDFGNYKINIFIDSDRYFKIINEKSIKKDDEIYRHVKHEHFYGIEGRDLIARIVRYLELALTDRDTTAVRGKEAALFANELLRQTVEEVADFSGYLSCDRPLEDGKRNSEGKDDFRFMVFIVGSLLKFLERHDPRVHIHKAPNVIKWWEEERKKYNKANRLDAEFFSEIRGTLWSLVKRPGLPPEIVTAVISRLCSPPINLIEFLDNFYYPERKTDLFLRRTLAVELSEEDLAGILSLHQRSMSFHDQEMTKFVEKKLIIHSDNSFKDHWILGNIGWEEKYDPDKHHVDCLHALSLREDVMDFFRKFNEDNSPGGVVAASRLGLNRIKKARRKR
jgi:hypothetical protein